MNLFGQKKKLLAGPGVPETATDFMMKLSQIKDLDLAKIEKFIELKNREDERNAKKEWDTRFAEMQMDYVPVAKTKEVKTKAGARMYKYAPLEEILKVYQPILSKHGFSYHFDQEELPSKMVTRIWCIVSGYGYDGKTFVDVPVMASNDYVNATQQIGSSISYAKRYAFVNLMGIIFEEEDDDGRAVEPQKKGFYEPRGTVENAEVEREEMATGRTLAQAYTEAARYVSGLQNKSIKVTLGSIMNRCRNNLANLEIFIDMLKKAPKPETPQLVADVQAAIKL